jgi:hypothetical protein
MQWIRNRRTGTVDPDVALQRKLARREALNAKLISSLRLSSSATFVRSAYAAALLTDLLDSYGLLAVGLLYIFAIPFPSWSKGTYVSENALQPAQVSHDSVHSRPP